MNRIIILSFVLLTACNFHAPLYVERYEYDKRTVGIYYEEYLDIDLCSANGRFIAMKLTTHNLLRVVDEKGECIMFDDSNQFINHMSKRGYKVTFKESGRLDTHYTFKR